MKQIILVICILTSIACFAQQAPATVSMPYIEVTGTASTEGIPDKIFISIVLSDIVKDQQNYTIRSQEENLRKSLAKININLQNLFLSNAESDIVLNKKKETGVKLTREYTLLVSSAAEVS